MYTISSDIVKAMTGSLTAGTSVQAIVRETFKQGESVDVVAEAVTEFKRETEKDFVPSQPVPAEARKRVNSVINDVSRVCRGLWGKSIVCVSKNPHTYEAVEPTPRAKPEPAAKEEPTAGEDTSVAESSEEALRRQIRELQAIIEAQGESIRDLEAETETFRTAPREAPTTLLRAIAMEHGVEELARMAVAVVKELS